METVMFDGYLIMIFYKSRHHCILYQFLLDYIGSVFLGQIRADNGKWIFR